MRYNLCKQRARACFLCVAALHTLIHGESTRLNNADPYPIFSSSGKYELLTIDAMRAIQEALDCDNQSYGLSERLHVSVSTFYQSASDGTDYRGNSVLTYYDNTMLPTFPSSALLAASAASGTTPQPASQIVNTVPMPLGAIPEAFNYFALLYPFNDDPVLTQQNVMSKIFARALGYDHAEFMKSSPNFPLPSVCGCQGSTTNPLTTPCYDPLQYGYGNYRNIYYDVTAFPATRDPNRLLGYGYFNQEYQKYGARAQLEFRVNPSMGMRIYTGIAHVQQDRITQIDTTTPYQGPTGANMYVRYPDQLDPAIGASSVRPNFPVSPNLYQLTPYASPNLDGDPTTPEYNDTRFPGGTPRFQNYVKSLYLQNIQNNYLQLAQVLGINMSPYHYTSLEDTTVECYWRTVKIYNGDKEKESGWSPYAVMPVFKAYLTLPTAPQVSPSAIFAKPLSNNGHWQFGGSAGMVVNFLETISVGGDIGLSYFGPRWYLGMPVPTHTLQEGIYFYKGDVHRYPGVNFTLGIGINADHCFDKVSFFGEYRLVKHSQDCFDIQCLYNPFSVEGVYNITQNNTTQTSANINSTAICTDTASPKTGWGTIPIPLGTGVEVAPATLYTDPSFTGLPLPAVSDVYVQHLIDTSAWTAHLATFSCAWDVSEWSSLGAALQFPIALTNAYNTATLSLSFEMRL